MENNTFDNRIQRLEKRVLGLACMCGILAVTLVLVLWKPIPREVKAAESPSILHLKGLVIEDAQGRARILVGAPFPTTHDRLRQDATTTTLLFMDEQGHDRFSIGEFMPAQINGKLSPQFHRIGSAYGLTIYDPLGNERGGMGFLTNGGTVSRASFALDRPGGDAIGLMVYDKTDFAGLAAMYSHEVGDYATGVLLATQGNKAFITMKDVHDMPRATFEVGSELSPSFRILDKTGKNGPDLLNGITTDGKN